MEMTRFSCPHAKQCGGCQLLQLPYPAQLEKKQRLVEELFGQYTPVQPILGMEHPVHYRNKIHATFGKGRDGRVVSGLYQPSSHRLVPIEHCLLEDEAAAEILAVVRQLMDQLHLPPYNDVTHTGLIRHLLIRRGYFSGQILVAVVTGQAAFPARKQFAEALRKACPQITTLVQNINPGRTSMVLGGQQRILYGPGYIEDQLCGCTFRISAASFYQVNPIQTQKLYQAALDMAGLTGTERVIDAYCGTGTIGILAARQAGQVLGVELNRAAVTDAIANARRNKAENIPLCVPGRRTVYGGAGAPGPDSRPGADGPAPGRQRSGVSLLFGCPGAQKGGVYLLQSPYPEAGCGVPCPQRLPCQGGPAGGPFPPHRSCRKYFALGQAKSPSAPRAGCQTPPAAAESRQSARQKDTGKKQTVITQPGPGRNLPGPGCAYLCCFA